MVRAKEAAYRAANLEQKRASVRRAHQKFKATYAERKRQIYLTNRGAIRARAKSYYMANAAYRAARLAAANRRAREKPDLVAHMKQQWERLNQVRNRPGRVLISLRRRVALRKAGSPGLTAAAWENALAYYGDACAYCLTPEAALTRRLTVDHLLPVCRGGTNDTSNLAPACLARNQKKSSRTPLEFLSGIRLGATMEAK